MNRDVFLAILAMDSYNRDYDARIKLPRSVKLGEASLKTDIDVPDADWEEAGFYAQAYEWNGQTIISYRGTDNLGILQGDSDIWNGWTIGAGFSATSQAGLALDFYKRVVERSFYGLPASNVILTGHSLGGGLAGFVGSLSGTTAVIFDHMPFGLAAYMQAIFSGKLISLDYPFTDKPRGYFVEGEVLENVRNGKLQEAFADLFSVVGDSLSLLPSSWTKAISAILKVASTLIKIDGKLTAELEENVRKIPLSVFDAELDKIQRHSQALHVILLYARTMGLKDWEEAAPYLLPAMFDNNIGLALGRNGGSGVRATGRALAGDQLMMAIAYSAIDEGERPFGDMGIQALFNDATDLGKILAASAVSENLKESASSISKALIQFAGQLAFAKRIKDDSNPTFLKGILTSSEGILSVDFSKDLWIAAGATENRKIVAYDELLTQLGLVDLRSTMTKAWGIISPRSIGNFIFSTNADATVTLAAHEETIPVTAYVGGQGVDQVTGSISGDLIIGNDGDDVLSGGQGNDILSGGEDFDTADYGDDTAGITLGLPKAGGFATVTDGHGNMDWLVSIERVVGSPHVDQFAISGAAKIVLAGGKGGDWYKLIGTGKNVKIEEEPGDDGTDVLVVGAGVTPDRYKRQRKGSANVLVERDGVDAPDVIVPKGIDAVAPGGKGPIDLSKFDQDDDPDDPLPAPAQGLGDGGGLRGNFPPPRGGGAGGDPLILDLNGDGAHSTNRDTVGSRSYAYFDLDNDGFAERTAWVSEGDGLLTFDKNGNGIIDNQTELFGDTATAADGFGHLRNLDLNGDRKITSADAAYANLRVWIDANQDGTTDAGELKTLAELKITEISVLGTPQIGVYDNENLVNARSTFVMNGAVREIADHWFRTDEMDSFWLGETDLNIEALFLPTLKGFGTLKDLHVAMSEDDDLLALVREFAASWTTGRFNEDFASLNEEAEAILFRWAGADHFTRTETYRGVNARENVFIERLTGRPFLPFAEDPTGTTPVAPIDSQSHHLVFTNIFDKLKALLQAQAGADKLFTGLFYDPVTGDLSGDATLSQTGIDTIKADLAALGSRQEKLNYLTNLTEFLVQVKAPVLYSDAEIEALNGISRSIVGSWVTLARQVYATVGYRTTGSAFSDRIVGSVGNDVLTGAEGSDTLNGGDGNDTLTGGDGDDLLRGGLGVDAIDGGTGDDQAFGDEGNDQINGRAGDDILAGGTGDDIVSGHTGNDTFIYDSGVDRFIDIDGDDRIVLTNPLLTRDKITLKLVQGVRPTLQVAFDGKVAFQILGQFTKGRVIETLEFADGSTFDLTKGRYVIVGTEGNDVPLIGTDAGADVNDIIKGLGGDDDIRGLSGNDLITGGKGRDTLEGGEGNDSYFYEVGDGEDIIVDTGGVDNLRVGAGYLKSDLSWNMDGNDLVLSLSGFHVVTVRNHFANTASMVEQVRFANGGDVMSLVNLPISFTGTDGSNQLTGTDFTFDTISGMGGTDTLYGLGGNDLLHGNLGNDYIYGGSGNDRAFGDEGNDYLYGDEGDDRLDGGLGRDNLYGGEGHDNLTGGAGVDTLAGGEGNDTLTGGADADTLSGGAGDDIYVFAKGGGLDTIEESGGDDTIKLGIGIQSQDIRFQHLNNDLIVWAGDAKITIKGQFDPGNARKVERLLLADGTSYDLTSGLVFRGIAGNDNLKATDGDDQLIGLEGLDQLHGGLGNDLLNGGPGNDQLFGELGNDRYVFARGWGTDIITDTGGTDAIQFATGISLADLRLSRTATGLIVFLGPDKITISQQSSVASAIESLRLADGTTLDLLKGLPLVGTAEAETITGTAFADTIGGQAGNDRLLGDLGDDTYLFSLGDGIDTITDTGGRDTIKLGAGIAASDLRFSRSGPNLVISFGANKITVVSQYSGDGAVERIAFADGSVLSLTGGLSFVGTPGADTIVATPDDDTLNGGAGNDRLAGGNGDDIYIFAKGDGIDTVTDTAGFDTLKLGAGIIASSLRFVRSGANLVIYYGQDRLTINDHFLAASAVEKLVFANNASIDLTGGLTFRGTVGDEPLLGSKRGDRLYGLAGNDQLRGDDGDDYLFGEADNDTLRGDDGADTLNGGEGNDRQYGGSGDDTYVAGRGAGIDTVYETDGNDVIRMASGIAAADLRFVRSGDALMIYFGADRLTIDGQYAAGQGVEQLVLADGTRLDLLGKIDSVGTASVDTLWGTDGNDMLSGLAGNDILRGDKGNDAARGGADNDRIYGGDGNDALAGEDGNDLLFGEAGRDRLIGGAGIDTLTGGADADTFVFEKSAAGFIDKVADFELAQSDGIELRGLLVGYNPATSLLSDFVKFEKFGASASSMLIDRDGLGAAYGFESYATFTAQPNLSLAALVQGNQIGIV